ncbi:MAG: AGE family epimerase/isomerase [Chthoniobacteraceae bacterium]
MNTLSQPILRHEIEQELSGNILPFWMNHTVDRVNGGFYGAVTNDLVIHNEIPRSSTLCARILWVYSTAYRRFGLSEYWVIAQWAYDYLTRVFWDHEEGGVYWEVDCKGHPVADRKHHYAQAFAIYGLAEYYRATQEPKCLRLVRELFHYLEKHARDPIHEGYTEGSSRTWGPLLDMRLSDKDLNCQKSVNTHLHILEAYTDLLRVWDDTELKARHRALIETFLEHILDRNSGHLKLFFDDPWHSLSETVSFGHDIECSWLLVEAAEMQGDAELLSQVRQSAVLMADAVYKEGRDADGSVFYEADPRGLTDTSKSWWAQAEAVVGFHNAYQISNQKHFAQAASQCWAYIQTHMVDRVHGDWFKQLTRDGVPDNTRYKVGPWDCPYHHSRACFEMLTRLEFDQQKLVRRKS